MDHAITWAIPAAVTAAVIAFAVWRQHRASARGLRDLPASPYFTIPDDTAEPGSRNAMLVLTTWDLVKRSFAEATLKAAQIEFTSAEVSQWSGDVVRGGPYWQIFVLNESQAAEARRILREGFASAALRRTGRLRRALAR